MDKIIQILRERKKQLQKENWSNKIRINEINFILELLKEGGK